MSSGKSRNNGWVTRRQITVVVAAVAALGCCAFASASPLCTVSLQARLNGTTDAFTSSLTNVQAGQVYDYRIAIQFPTAPTANANADYSFYPAVNYDGLAVLWFDLNESASAPIQVSFAPVFDPDNDSYIWMNSTGTTPGTPTARAGGNGFDLISALVGVSPTSSNGARGIATTGPQGAGVQNTTLTLLNGSISSPSFGTFTINSLGSGGLSTLNVVNTSDPLSVNFAAMKFTNAAHTDVGYSISKTSQSGADPVFAFQGLTLQAAVPEPATLVMLQLAGGMIFGCMYLMRRKRRKAAVA